MPNIERRVILFSGDEITRGQLTAIVQTAEETGAIYFKASAPGVKGATLELIRNKR